MFNSLQFQIIMISGFIEINILSRVRCLYFISPSSFSGTLEVHTSTALISNREGSGGGSSFRSDSLLQPRQ